MNTPSTSRAYVGAQNDALYIVVGEPPASTNDYPRHDADRTAIAKVYDAETGRRLAACWNACDGLSTEALESAGNAFNGWRLASYAMNDAIAQRDELLAALKNWLGPADDPKAGWQGSGGTRELFACPYCNAKHGDCTQIPHSSLCPIPNARAAIAKATRSPK